MASITSKKVLRIEDFEQKKSGLSFIKELTPTERLIWLYIQSNMCRDGHKNSKSLLKTYSEEECFSKIISCMVNEGWVTGDEALKSGYSLIQKTDLYLNE